MGDLMAAITDIVMVIPQAMGYALVAGLPPINGLYSALMGHCLYSPFGSSGQLIVAPVAIVSLMTKETLEHYFHGADPSDPVVGTKMAAYGSALSFRLGVICLLLGFCKAGVLANMLAEPVIVGFCFAAAILIGISQLTFVFQIHVHGENVVEKLITFFSEIGHSHGPSVGLAVCCIIFLLCVKFFTGSKLPGSQYGKFIPSALGVFASIVLFIQRAAKPNYSILGRVVDLQDQNGTPVYRDVKMYPSNTEKRGDMLMIRWDAPIFFANAASFKKRVKKHIGRFLEENDYPKPWCLVLDFSGVNDVDYSGLEMLEAFIEELKRKERGMTLLLAKLKTPVLNSLTKGNVISEHCVPKEHVLWELHEAEQWWDRALNEVGAMDQSAVHGSRHYVRDQSTTDNAGYAGNHLAAPEQYDDEEDVVTMR